jgi:hypothetical protein
MDSDGNPLWGANGGGTDNDYAGGLVIDANDNIYFNGNYDNVEAHFGSTTLPNVNGYEIFTAKLNPSGTFEWAVSANGPGDDKGMGLDFVPGEGEDPGFVLTTGYFEDTLSVGSSYPEFISNGNDDVFVLAFDESTGDYVGGLTYGGADEDQAKRINYKKGSNGSFFVSGNTKSDLPTPDGSVLTNYGSRDIFVLYYNQENLMWVQNYGGDNYDYVNDTYLNAYGDFYFSGTVKSSVSNFEKYNLVSKGSYDLYLAQMHIPLTVPVILEVSDIPNDQGGKVRIIFTGTELANSFTIWRQIDNSENWDAVGSFNGIYQSFYSYVAQTLGDSTVDGVHLSTFKVSAHSNNDILGFTMSEPVSGYSVDNLAPAVPSNIIADGFEDRVELAWDNNEGDKDFKYYAIYRSLDSEFNPDTMSTYTYSTIDGWFNDNDVEIGNTYYYKIVAVDFAGNKSEYSEQVYALITDVNADVEIPTVYELGQNYPNPFNPSTVINFSLPESGMVTLKVFDILGQEVAELVNEVKQAGIYTVSFDASNMTTGLYIYRIESGSFRATKKMMLVK